MIPLVAIPFGVSLRLSGSLRYLLLSSLLFVSSV
jgi:hypothetical protein